MLYITIGFLIGTVITMIICQLVHKNDTQYGTLYIHQEEGKTTYSLDIVDFEVLETKRRVSFKVVKRL